MKTIDSLIDQQTRIVEQTLLRERENPPVFEAASFRETHANDLIPSPLTALQVQQLRLRKPGVFVLCGSEANGLDAVQPYLRSAFQTDFVELTGVVDPRRFEEWLRQLAGGRPRETTTMAYIGPSLPWDAAWIEIAENRLASLRLHTATLHILFAADSSATLRLVADGYLDGLSATGVTTMSLQPWDDTYLRHWLTIRNNSSEPEVRQRIRGTTGNRPLLLRRYIEGLADSSWPQALERIGQELGTSEGAGAILKALGLGSRNSMERRVLTTLAEYRDAVRLPELVTLLDDQLPADQIRPIMRWAELMALVIVIDDNTWQADPFVAKLLLSTL